MKAFLITLTALWATLTASHAQQVAPLFPCTETLSSPYGICSHISRPSMDYHLREQNLDQMNQLKVDWVRSDLDYSTLYPNRRTGAPDPSVFDSTLLSCEQKGVQWLPILDRSSGKGFAWADTTAYLAYVDLLGQRYKGRIRHWEVINEVNLIGGATPGERAAQYSSVLRQVSRHLKAIDPGNLIVHGGQSEVWDEFLERVCEEGAYRYFDVMNFHTYRAPEELPASFERLAGLMKKYGWEKAVWLTETGFYTLPPATPNHEAFFSQVIPEALRRIGLKGNRHRIAVVYETGLHLALPQETQLQYLRHIGSPLYIGLRDLAGLDPRQTPLLIASWGEYFPKEYVKDVVNYVRQGGTLICPRGVPFYYNAQEHGSYVQQGENEGQKALRLSFRYPWDKRQNVPEIPAWCSAAQGMGFDYGWSFNEHASARYISDAALLPGDEMIPLVEAGDAQFRGCVAALLRLRHDMKGNVILQTRLDEETHSEQEQAARLPRAYLISMAYGVDRVFWYHLRSFEQDPTDAEHFYGIVHHDFAPKPAMHALQTLTRMCPEGSTRPTLHIEGDRYTASWTTPDGRHVTALWTIGRPYVKKLERKAQSLTSCTGEILKNTSSVNVSSMPVYITR